MNSKNSLLQIKQKAVQNPYDANIRYELAYLLDEENELKQAVAEYEKAVKFNPHLYQAWFDLGMAYTREKNYAGAITSWKKIEDPDNNLRLDKINYHKRRETIKECASLWEGYYKTQTSSCLTLFNAACAFMFLGDFKRAKEIFSRLLEQIPNFDMANYYLALTLSFLKEKEKVQFYLNEELKYKPHYLPVIFSIAEAQYKQGNLAQAIKQFETVIKIKNNHTMANFYLGLIYSKLNNFDRAAVCLNNVLEQDGTCAEAHFELAKIFEKKFQMDKAIKHYCAALEVNPDYKEVHFALAVVYKNLAKPGDALNHFQKIIQLDPADYEVHYYTGEIYAQLGKFHEAIKEYKKATELAPLYGYAHYGLGRAYLRLNQMTQAAESFKKVLSINPKDTQSRNLLGVTYFKLGNLSQSIEVFQGVLKLNPQDVYAHYYLGAVYFKLQDFENSIKEYQKIAELKPESAYAYFALGAAFSRSGDFENAVQQFQKAADLILNPEVDMVLFATLQLLAVIGMEHAQQGKKVGELYMELEEAFKDTVKSLAKAVDARDPYTQYHSDRVSKIAKYLAQESGLKKDEIEKIEIAGYLHDIGKLAVKDEILQKKGALTPEEEKIMRLHPVKGAEIIKGIKIFHDITALVKHHHENFDGTGYPDGLKENEITIGAQIIGIADFYDALITDRPYKKALTEKEALEEIKKLNGTKFGKNLVESFMKISGNLPKILKDFKKSDAS